MSGFDILPAQFQLVAECEFQIVWVSLTSRKLFDRLERPEGPVAAYFTADVKLPVKREEDARVLSGWVARQRGRTGKFWMYDPTRLGPAYDLTAVTTQEPFSDATYFADGTGWLSGKLPPQVQITEAERIGNDSIVVDFGTDWASTDNIMRMGDRIEVRPGGIPAAHSHYYELTLAAKTNSLGKTRLVFEPGLQASVAAGDAVILRYPRALMQFATDSEGRIRWTPPMFGSSGFSVIESLPE